MTAGETQIALFESIKSKLAPGESLADPVSRILNISPDSVYRRMRGEITLSIQELILLCEHFRISIDTILGKQPGLFVFNGQFVNRNFKFAEYLQSVLKNLKFMESFREKEFYYLCKDLPIFHHFHCREIAAFKWFFWLKSYFEFPEFKDRKFKFDDHPEDIFALEQQILDTYNKIPSVEIWNLETMNILFRQIDFYRQGNLFESSEDVLKLYQAIEWLWDHLEEQAALGYKFDMRDPDKKPQAPIRMYFNEVLLGDNNMLAELDGKRITFISHTTINFMSTTDPEFNDNMFQHIQNQMRRSTLISEVSEKERSRFFHIIREKIRRRKEAIV